MKLGNLELHSVSGGRLSVDGGTMFGIVPKTVWQRKSPPDERNRIPLETNCLLVRTPSCTALIDTGYGSKATARERKHHGLQDGSPLVDSLAAFGLGPNDIDLVVLTHLHSDHAGGCTRRGDHDRLMPTFPRARHVVQQIEWRDATAGLPELAGAYCDEDVQPLKEAGLLDLVDGNLEIAPGIRSRLTGGHTRGHQILYLGVGREQAVYLGDLCPLSAHLNTLWTTAYEQFPLSARRVKSEVLSEAAAERWLVLYAHDPLVKAGYVVPDEKRNFVATDAIIS